MKKILTILLVTLCCAGVIYLGFVVFRAKNIESVELVGEMQTVYLINDDIDFEDAKLKVTYKNGDIRMIDLNSNEVSVDYFSTSIEKHGKMNIVYKSHVNSVEYDVINKGCYFVESTKTILPSSTTTSPTYTKDTTNEIIYLDDNGVVKYYQKQNSKWYLNDGKYDSTFKYSIKGKVITVTLGSNKTVKLTPNYDKDINNNTKIYLTSESKQLSENGEFVTSKTITTYGWYSMKTNRTLKENPELDLSKTDYVQDSSVVQGNAYVVFNINETIESSGKEIYIKVTMMNDNDYLPVVYVKVTDKMVQRQGSKINTSSVCDPTFALMFYESKPFYLYYAVK